MIYVEYGLDSDNNRFGLGRSVEVAKQRVLKRTKENHNELFIDANCFNERLRRYEPITDDEHLHVIKYFSNGDKK